MNPPKPHLAYESSVCRNTIKILLPVIKPIEFQLRGSKYGLVVLRRTMWYFVPVRSRKNVGEAQISTTYLTSPVSPSKLPY